MVHNHFKHYLQQSFTHYGTGGEGGGEVTHHSVHKLVKMLHSNLFEEVHVRKDVDWT